MSHTPDEHNLEAKRRAGRREANLRTLNERIAAANERLSASSGDDVLSLVCECSMPQCEESIEVTAADFEQMREETTRFLVVDGHVLHEVENVVDRGEGWIMVEKHGVAAEEARRVLE